MGAYHTGTGDQQIILTVDISTIGLAGTRATIKKPDGSLLTVAASGDVTGDISPAKIGKANELQGSSLIIAAKIDLNILSDLAARKKEFEQLNGAYTLDGGIDGYVVFDKPDKKVPSDDYKIVVLAKTIELL